MNYMNCIKEIKHNEYVIINDILWSECCLILNQNTYFDIIY